MKLLRISIATLLMYFSNTSHAQWGALGKLGAAATKAGSTASTAAKLGGASMVGFELNEAAVLARAAQRGAMTVEELSARSMLKMGAPDELVYYLKIKPETLLPVEAERVFAMYQNAAQPMQKIGAQFGQAVQQIPPHQAWHLLHHAAQAGHAQAKLFFESECRLDRLNWGFEPVMKHKHERDRLRDLQAIDSKCMLL